MSLGPIAVLHQLEDKYFQISDSVFIGETSEESCLEKYSPTDDVLFRYSENSKKTAIMFSLFLDGTDPMK